jgi:hypothetical protein
MEEPKRNPMKKVSWLIVAIAVLSSVIVHLPKVIPVLDKNGPDTSTRSTGVTNPTTVTGPSSSPSTANSATGITSAVADPTLGPLNYTAGGPTDVADEIRNATTPGNDTSPPPMEAAVLMMKADHEGWRSGCKPGVLLLDGSGLHFTCIANIGKNVDVLLADIASVDKSGIKDREGHPDHFKIQNADPE